MYIRARLGFNIKLLLKKKKLVNFSTEFVIKVHKAQLLILEMS